MITLSNGNLQSLAGVNPANCSIEFSLPVDCTLISSPGILLSGLQATFNFDTHGNLIGTCQIWSGSEFTPSGVGYTVNIFDQNGARLAGPLIWVFNQTAGATVDIGTMRSINQASVQYPFFPGATVTSVGLTGSPIFTITGSPITQQGTFNIALANESANTFLAGPTSGGATTPTFRSLVGSDLPLPTASTLGGIESFTAVSHQWINSISTSGVPSSTQPAFSDISGVAIAGQLPSTAVNAITNDTNVTGSISAQNLTLGWSGTLAKGRTLATTVYTDQVNTFGAFVQTFQAGANHLLTDTTDTTKKFQFDASNIATATTRTVNIPNANSTTAQTISVVSHNFLTGMSAQGVFTQAQPAASDLSNGTTGSGAVVLATSPTLVTPALGSASATELAVSKIDLDSSNKDVFLTRNAAATLQHGDANSATPVNQTITTQGSRGGTDTNVSGANLTITSGPGTGNSAASSLAFQTPTVGSSGTTAQTLATRLTIHSTDLTLASGVNLILSGATSGTTTLQATAAASGTLTLPAATDTLTGKATTDTLSNKTLTGAGSGNAVNLLYQILDNATSFTGTGADQVMQTYTIPANTIAANKGIRVKWRARHFTGSASVTFTLKFGSTIIAQQATTSNIDWFGEAEIYNKSGVQNAQQAITSPTFLGTGPAVASGLNAGIAENTANALAVALSFNSPGTDTAIGTVLRIELMQ